MTQLAERGLVKHINPDSLIKSPAFTNVITVTGPVKTIYIGGQDPVNEKGETVAKGDFAAQTEQILKNIEAALEAAGAGLQHVIKWNVYAVQGQPVQEGFQAFLRAWGNRGDPPVITVVFVAGLGNPDWLAEIDAVVVVPE